MKRWIAFWNILMKDVRTYYLKPPNVSWGLLFPLAWTGMFFLRSQANARDILSILTGLVCVSVLFGTTSLLAVTITFEKKNRTFERLLLSPLPLNWLVLAKTSGGILFGLANALVPVLLACFLTDLSKVGWGQFGVAVFLLAVSSTFLGLLIAVSVSEVFEAQAFSNFFRFPMIFLCGLFFPISRLPFFLWPLSFILPPTYGADLLHGAIEGIQLFPGWLDLTALVGFCLLLFFLSLWNIRRRWIL